MSTFTWAPPTGSDQKWSTGGNWKVGGVVQTNPPTSSDDAVLGTGLADCKVTGVNGDCKSVSSSGTNLEIDATLHVHGGTSSISSGLVFANTASGSLLMDGGTMSYDNASIDYASGQNYPSLTVYCYNGHFWTFGASFADLGASFYIGQDPNATNSAGNLTVSTTNGGTVTTRNSATMTVATQGHLAVNARMKITNMDFGTLAGSLVMYDSTEIDLATGTSLVASGGEIIYNGASGTVGKIVGSVTLTNGSKLQLGDTGTTYDGFTIIGDFSMSGSTYQTNANAADLTQCSTLSVSGKLDLSAGGDTFICYTNGTLKSGTHSHSVITSGSVKLQTNGKGFDTFNWRGNNHVWNYNYTGGFNLT